MEEQREDDRSGRNPSPVSSVSATPSLKCSSTCSRYGGTLERGGCLSGPAGQNIHLVEGAVLPLSNSKNDGSGCSIPLPQHKGKRPINSRTEFMSRWESKAGNEARNVPMAAPPKNYDLGKEIRMKLIREKLVSQEIRASFYARSKGSTENMPMPHNKHFLVIHFGDYCTNYLGSHPAEFCIADFSIRDGINTCYSRMLDPGKIPFGFRSDFIAIAEERGYELPGFDPDINFRTECLDIIENLMNTYTASEDEPGVLYTLRTEMNTVKGCLEFVSKKAGRAFTYRLFPLPRLIELLLIEGDHLRSLNNMPTSNLVFSEEDALSLILKGNYDSVPELACSFHNFPTKLDAVDFCSMSLVKRWIYNGMKMLTKMYCCPMFLHNHVPKYQKDGFFTIEKPLPVNVDHLVRSKSWNDAKTSASKALSLSDTSDSNLRNLSLTESGSGRGRLILKSTDPSDGATGKGTSAPLSMGRTTAHGSSTPLTLSSIPEDSESGTIPKNALATHQKHPDFENIEAYNRGMRPRKVRPERERQFPSKEESEKLAEVIMDFGELMAAVEKFEARPTGSKVFQWEGDENLPLNTNYTFPPNPKAKGLSPISAAADVEDNLTSVSKAKPVEMAPGVAATLEQAHQIITHGVMPQTKFVESDRLFWDTSDDGQAPTRGQTVNRVREAIVPGQVPGLGPIPEDGRFRLPPQPVGGRGYQAKIFWERIQRELQVESPVPESERSNWESQSDTTSLSDISRKRLF